MINHHMQMNRYQLVREKLKNFIAEKWPKNQVIGHLLREIGKINNFKNQIIQNKIQIHFKKNKTN